MVKLGFVSAILPDLSLDEVITFAGDKGFSCIEIMCWPSGRADRRYAGVSHINVESLDNNEINIIKDKLKEKNVTVSGLGYYPNPLHPDKEKSDFYIDHIKKVIDAAARLEIGLVNTFIGADPAKHDDDNFEKFREVWPPIVKYAEDRNIKIGIENCPMYFSKDEWPSGNNLAHSPSLWRKIFETIPSPNFGLNYDPSHFIWQMMDYIKPIYEFRNRIFHVHLKDTRIIKERLDDVGILTTPLQFYTPKIPGLGDIDWGRFFSALYEAGYNGSACIEVEDRAFEGSIEARKNSLLISRNHLRQFVTE